ncbi:MAG: VgrG-related protein [Acidimicrobiia bacterium]
MPQQPSVELEVKVEGSPLPADIAALLRTVLVEDSLQLPDLFILTFLDDERMVLSKAGIRIGTSVSVGVSSEPNGSVATLITGEVTALEAEYGSGGSLTTVRGFDKSHRLFGGRTTAAYKNVTYSDVVRTVATRAGLTAGSVTATGGVYPLVTQRNQSDWQFLTQLAVEVGFEVAVRDGKIDFGPPPAASSAPASGDHASDDALQLVPGKSLLRLRSAVSAAQQVGEVKVRSWDPKTKQAIIGSASASTTSASLPVNPAGLANAFGNPTYIGVDVPYSTQGEADAAAKGIAEEIGSSFAELEGLSRGSPKLKAGEAVSLGVAGAPFDGRYTLTATRHSYDPEEGYVTWFTASGRRDRTLLGLASNGQADNADGRIPGVVSALVTNVNDPEEIARVKVKFPWLADDYESDWVRTVQAGAGSMRGAVYLPEVNDEVLVSFEQGDVRRPYVVGGLYNGVDKPNVGSGLVDGAGAVKRRGFISRKGHRLVFIDGDDKAGLALLSGNQALKVSMNQTEKRVKVTSDGEVVIIAQGDVKVQAQGNIDLSGAKVTVKARSGVSIDAGAGPFEVKSAGQVSIKGTTVAVNGDATAELKTSGVLTVQGSLVKIN